MEIKKADMTLWHLAHFLVCLSDRPDSMVSVDTACWVQKSRISQSNDFLGFICLSVVSRPVIYQRCHLSVRTGWSGTAQKGKEAVSFLPRARHHTARTGITLGAKGAIAKLFLTFLYRLQTDQVPRVICRDHGEWFDGCMLFLLQSFDNDVPRSTARYLDCCGMVSFHANIQHARLLILHIGHNLRFCIDLYCVMQTVVFNCWLGLFCCQRAHYLMSYYL